MEDNLINELKEQSDKAVELRNKIVTSCKDELDEVLKKYNCKLVGVPSFIPSSNGWNVITRIEIDTK